MRFILYIAGASLVAGQAFATDLAVEIGIPRLDVAEYHRPYVAAWIARPDQSVAANLAVWYQQGDGPEGEGTTWLKDLRQWWRRTGRQLDLPIDGVSGPTRAPGSHEIQFSGADFPLANHPAGDYTLYVEAAREVGGRELISIPFTWDGSAVSKTASGSSELETVRLKLIP